MRKLDFEKLIVVICIISAIALSFIALFIPPQGIIDGSVLMLVAEILVFCGSVLGIRVANLKAIKDIANHKK